MSMLPVWEVKIDEELVDGATVFRIMCPHCGETAIVSRKWTKPRIVKIERDGVHEVMIVGRSCTYCFKTSQVPEQFPGGKPRG